MSYAINSLDGKTLIEVVKDKPKHLDEMYCVNKICGVRIENDTIYVRNKKKHEFLEIVCQNNNEAELYALINLGWTCVFDLKK